ncbi:ATP phosphoribosyltransferase regulatory subunit [Ferroplasma sp.]|uniref:ATP phosphoribosyltransferase regulatory subunit n=1 Tax=Ferroplasma sp. TaxID=2591003 RepID=UPI00307DA1CD
MKAVDWKLSELAYRIRESSRDAGYIEIFPPSYVKSDKVKGFRFIFRNNVYVFEPDITTRLINRIKENARIYYISQQIDEFLNESIEAGLEIIGGDENETNVEIIEMAIKILDALGLKDYNIDISLAGIFNSYRDQGNTELINAVRNRNYQQIEDMEIKNREKLLEIMETRTRKSGIKKLDDIIERINDPRVIIDLGTVRQPEYYDGLIFEIYSNQGFLGGGGNYKTGNMNGCGFSLDLRALSKLDQNIYKRVKK